MRGLVAVRLLDGELDVHQAAHLQRPGHGLGLALQLGDDLGRQREGRHGTGAVARVHPGLLDVFQHAGHEHRLVVAQGVDVHLGGAVQIVVDQDRVVARHPHGLADIAVQLFAIVDDHPCRVRPARRRGAGRRDSRPRPPCAAASSALRARPLGGWRSGRCRAALLEPLAVLGQVDGVERRCPGSGCRPPAAAWASFSGVWPPNCTTTPISVALRPLDVDQLQHVLGRQRLEIQPVGGVVVGRDGLGVAVDHDRLDADVGEGEGRVAAAVVELDPLPDPVRTAAQDDGLLRGRSARTRTRESGPAPRSRRSNTYRRWPRRTRRRRCRCA